MKTLNDAVVERLYKYMGEKNLTQYKLAQLSGIPFPTIKSIMQRRTNGISCLRTDWGFLPPNLSMTNRFLRKILTLNEKNV